MTIKPAAVFASGPNTERGKPTRLTVSPKDRENLVYASGNYIIIRNVKNPLIVDIFGAHRVETTVARISPTQAYVASGDVQGNLLVWDLLNKTEHIIKYQKKTFSQGIFDIAWNENSDRILAVGDGKDVKGEIFIWDSGSNVGDISGHTSRLQTCAIRQQRPYRIATGGDDKIVNFYKGPPFRFEHSNREQQRFVNTIEYSPDGSVFVASGGDHKIYVYDGLEGKKKGEFSATNEHKMSIFSSAFSPDGKTLFTASADKTCKLWDVSSGEVISTFANGSDLTDTPVGVAWTAVGPVAVQLRGDIAFYDINAPAGAGGNIAPVNVWRSLHKNVQNVSVSATAGTGDDATNRAVDFVASGIDGQFLEYNLAQGAHSFQGSSAFLHEGKPVVSVVYSSTLKRIISLGADDRLLVVPTTGTFNPAKFVPISLSTSSSSSTPTTPIIASLEVKQPRALALFPDQTTVVIGSLRNLVAADISGPTVKVIASVNTTYDVNAIAAGPNGIVAVGGQDHFVHLLKLNVGAKSLTEYATSKGGYSFPVASVGISPDGKWVASGRNQFINFADTTTGVVREDTRILHTAKVIVVEFSPDGKYLLSTGVDCVLYLWDLNDPNKFIKYVGAHPPAGVTTAKWINNTTFITGGHDYLIRTWNVNF